MSWVSSSGKSTTLSSFGLTLALEAVVWEGLSAQIIPLKPVAGELVSGAEEMFVVAANVPLQIQGVNRCSITPTTSMGSKVWFSRCTMGGSTLFKFKDSEEGRRFEQMYLSLVEEKELAEKYQKRMFFIIMLVPLMVYFLLSLMGWIFFRLFRYVKGNED